MSDRVLELRGVSLSFGGLSVLERLDLHVDHREIVSVIGPNGAGKTTLFNVITGLYRPHEGEILFEGQHIAGMPSHKINRLGIARTFQTLRLFLNMSVKENVMAVQYGKTRSGMFRSILRTLLLHLLRVTICSRSSSIVSPGWTMPALRNRSSQPRGSLTRNSACGNSSCAQTSSSMMELRSRQRLSWHA